jgi:hypothetical protein
MAKAKEAAQDAPLVPTELTQVVEYRGTVYRPGERYLMSEELRGTPEIKPFIKA